MKHIDEQVWWKYVDGECSKEEKLQIESLLAEDPSLAEEMLLRSTLHHEMSEMELIAPSMDFNKNVMDALPQTITISEVAPLVSSKMKWSFFILSGLFLLGLLSLPFFLEGSTATAPSHEFPVISQVSLWIDAMMLAISQSMPTLPEIQVPTIPTSFLQLIGVLILGTMILLIIDKFAADTMKGKMQL